MYMPKGPGIGPEDFEPIAREMREWRQRQRGVAEEALRIVQEFWAELEQQAMSLDPDQHRDE